MKRLAITPFRSSQVCLLVLVGCAVVSAQIATVDPVLSSATQVRPIVTAAQPASIDLLIDPASDLPPQGVVESSSTQHGFIVRNLRRGLEDQKELYRAPFKAENLKWDALFLGTTGALLAADRHISRAIPEDHVNISHDVALFMLLGTGASAGSIWLYGLKKGDSHADETGQLTLESLANTFLIYTPMQFIAGRERPDEGTGNGRFLRHGNFNTSFPAGHPMFTWAMASVVAHEYPRRWVKLLSYGAAFSLSACRLTGRNHFASDIWVGSIFGYLIGTHIFHAHCDPNLSDGCHRER